MNIKQEDKGRGFQQKDQITRSNDYRVIESIEDEDPPTRGQFAQVSYKPIGPQLRDIIIDQDIISHNNQNANEDTILFDPVIRSGIVRFEVQNLNYLDSIGITDESVHFDIYQKPDKARFDKIAIYHKDGLLEHNLVLVKGNSQFRDKGLRVAIEVNMDSNPRTATFFVEGKEQKNYIVDIPSSIRFWVYIEWVDSVFRITQFEQFPKPSAKHGLLKKKRNWGQTWERDFKMESKK
ncbi:MAG: hypothetical protein EZS28_023087 [Streblomastix strix]|uniref:Uncharacterized protein n=1 Tax=Streblomastix strix TaxID=222440 RepID=A0A5J4VGD0_9EUKA|nr:MAG: hypothetical protein EZS28_023087 [Streblomastix strix]